MTVLRVVSAARSLFICVRSFFGQREAMSRSVILFITALLFLSCSVTLSQGDPSPKKVLVIFEGNDIPESQERGEARQMAQLLGHFNTSTVVRAANDYKSGEIDSFDFVFFFGFSNRYSPPEKVLKDIFTTSRQVVWLNTGFDSFCRSYPVKEKYGFTFVAFDTASQFTTVRARGLSFSKGEPNCNIVKITNSAKCQVLATAVNLKRQEVPYIIQSGNFIYVADSPFSEVTETDRYILFADLLHDILGEDHPVSHTALVRIEDVSPLEDPTELRNVADVLAGLNVPFLVSVIPFYVEPAAGIRVSMSEKPDFVDALHYMVEHGATIVMHGVTHQYRGQTGMDYEFWDESADRPIKNDSKEYVERKITAGIEECMRNGIYPLLWETPHYGASTLDYSVISTFFSSVIEQRQTIDRLDYGQYFPYLIKRDLYGQRIYPENLGYVPLSDSMEQEQEAVKRIIRAAESNLAVRDGYASFFFHPFLPLELLKELVESIQGLGYTFADLRQDRHLVHTKNKVIATGESDILLTLDDQYLRETYIDDHGQVVRREISPQRIKGKVQKHIVVDPGWLYVAEPTELREYKASLWDKVSGEVSNLVQNIIPQRREWAELRPMILWNAKAQGGASNDQASLASAFASVNVHCDTLFVGQPWSLERDNVLVVPYGSTDSLSNSEFDKITSYVETGGNIVLDEKTDLAQEFGIKFTGSLLKMERIRDRLYPEETFYWRKPEIMFKFDTESRDEIFCIDEKTEAPVVVGRRYGEGRILFFGTRFDPLSDAGYSRYPYLLEYMRRFFNVSPVFRRDFLEFYFDPGYRHNISIEQLVKRWRSQGVRCIHAAGWHMYPKWTYDYARLIELCHANGILVYLWLDPPQVSEKFWREHPQWREKNYKGDDVRPSWRYPVALTDSDCLKAVLATTDTLLRSYDWDGVDIAELYFESDHGPENPSQFTPMHPSARKLFAARYGFDPALLFDVNSSHYWKSSLSDWQEFEDFRSREVTYLHQQYLTLASKVESEKPGFEVLVTVLDNTGSPELRRDIGIDVGQIIGLQKQYQFTLQVEDAQALWSTDPRRYAAIGKRLRGLLSPSSDLMLDLNILSFRKPDAVIKFPTLIQTGIESYLLVNSASTISKRITIYAESSVNPQDIRFFPYAMASQATVTRQPNGWTVDSPFPLTLELSRDVGEILLDGSRSRAMPEGLFLIPSGKHEIQLPEPEVNPFQSGLVETRVLSVTGDLKEESPINRGVEFRYSSKTRCVATFNREPYVVFLDGEQYSVNSLKGFDCYALLLPPGDHKVLVISQSGVSYGIDLTSWWSSSLIVVFGFLSGGVLLAFYFIVRVRRRRVESGI
jgi:uncharacterized protein YdaL